MSLAFLFHFLCAQHVSDINLSTIRSLRLCCWITTLVVLFLVRCVVEIWCENKTTDVVIQQNSRKLLMMDKLMSETCWAHKKWNKKASDIKLVFYSSAITMMHGPINIRLHKVVWINISVPTATTWTLQIITAICTATSITNYELTFVIFQKSEELSYILFI